MLYCKKCGNFKEIAGGNWVDDEDGQPMWACKDCIEGTDDAY